MGKVLQDKLEFKKKLNSWPTKQRENRKPRISRGLKLVFTLPSYQPQDKDYIKGAVLTSFVTTFERTELVLISSFQLNKVLLERQKA